MDAKGSSGRATPERPLRPGDLSSAASADCSTVSGQTPLYHEALIGANLDGRYRIQSLIGIGGMSAVYKASDIALNKVVAVKMLHPHLSSERRSLERFLQEGRTESSLAHPNIVSVLAAGSDDGRLFLVMDYLEGKSLDDVISLGGPIPQMAARSIFVQICEALQHAHSKGIVHRDLKPSNIMLVGPNFSIVKLVDFGVAKVLSPEDVPQNVTGAGAIVGSPPYMSPEQCGGGSPDARSDIYSMGCLMYEALTGKLPLPADSSFAMICRQINDVPPPFAQTAPQVEVRSELEAVVFRALEKLPENRYQSAAELMQALKALELDASSSPTQIATIAQRSSTLAQSGTRTLPAGARKVSKAAIAASVLVALIIVGTVGFFNRSALVLAFSMPSLERNFQDIQSKYGNDSPQCAVAELPMADLYWDAGLKGKAIPLYRRVVAADGKWPMFYHFPAQQEVRLAHRAASGPAQEQQILMELAHSHKNFEDTGNAMQLLDASLEVVGGFPHLQQQALLELATMASSIQNYKAEQRYVERALKMMQEDKSLASDLVMSALLLKRAECDRVLTGPEAAIESYRKALTLMPAKSRIDFARRAGILENIGRCLQEASRGDEAIQSYLSAAEELKRTTPPKYHELAETYRIIGNYYFQVGNSNQAEKYYKQCLLLGDKLPPEELQQVEELISDCCFRTKRFSEQQRILSRLIAASSDDAERVRVLEAKLAQSKAYAGR